MKVCVETRNKVIERYVAILGASDKNQRGLAVYDSIDKYNDRSLPMPQAFTLMFMGGVKKNQNLFKTNGVSLIQPSLEDLEFLEAALRAVADFITEAARLGGGGLGPAPAVDPPLSRAEVVERLTFGCVESSTFPCSQSVPVTGEMATVNMGIVPTMTTFTHASTGGAQYVEEEDISPLAANYRVCIVCKKTESDVRSVSSKGLLRCSKCRSVNERYCGRECQKSDCKSYI
jgi:hypothetical protein